MRLIICLCFLISLCNGFILNQNYQNPSIISSNDLITLSQLSDCSANQLNAAYAAIATCEVSDIDTTIQCVGNAINKNYNAQHWNVFAKNTKENPDTVVFWYFNNCLINVNDYGKFNRTYVLWPNQNYPNMTKKNTRQIDSAKIITELKLAKHKENSIRQNQIQQLKAQSIQPTPNAQCPAWKIAQVKTIIQVCDVLGNDHAAQCIMNRIQDQMDEYWDVYVSTTIKSNVNYWYYTCDYDVNNFGTYSRYISAWKAK